MSEEYLTVFTTTGKRTDADRIARMLVEERLAACVQVIGPIESTYRWEGKVETSQEWLCLIKSTSALYETLEGRLKETHPYETPEIVALPIVRGSQTYLSWLHDTLEGCSSD